MRDSQAKSVSNPSHAAFRRRVPIARLTFRKAPPTMTSNNVTLRGATMAPTETPRECPCPDRLLSRRILCFGRTQQRPDRHRHHRYRLCRPGHGDPAQAARHRRFPRVREGRHRRRHLARQPLSWLCLRCPITPVLVFVRAQSGLVAHVFAAAGDPRLPGTLHRPVRGAPARALQPRAEPGGLRRCRRRVDPGDGRRAPLPCAHPDLRHGWAEPPVVAQHPGHRNLSGQGLPLAAVGARLRPARQACRRHRHRCVGHPVRAADRTQGRATGSLPAHAALDPAQARSRSVARRALAVPPSALHAKAGAQRASTGCSSRACWVSCSTPS